MVGRPVKSYPIDLECGHRLWFRTVQQRPSRRVRLWCRSCQTLSLQMALVVNSAKTTWPEGWASTPLPNGDILGECNTCDTTVTDTSFRKTEQLMFQHLAIDHGGSSLIARYSFTPVRAIGEAPF